MAKYRYGESVTVGVPYEPVVLLPASASEPKRASTRPQQSYEGIRVESNRWIKLACDAATDSVGEGGGPFGAVLLQIDDETDEVIRYWIERNRVTELNDPTAHAEVSVIRAACRELGTVDLGCIKKQGSPLPQDGETSHCEIYSSCEPCPMCYSAIVWARIPVLVFSATRYDAAEPGAEFMDEEIYSELSKDFCDRGTRVYHAPCPGALEAFETWRRSNNKPY